MPSQILKNVEVRNFKRFQRFNLPCYEANVLVGPNNAGKSTLLDAFRILFGALRYASRLRPKLINTQDGQIWGYEIPDSSIPIDISNTTYNYSDADAEVEFTHDNGNKLKLLLNPSHLTHLYIYDVSQSIQSGRSYFAKFPIDVVIVPTLSPFEQEESYVLDRTVDRNRSTRLASRYFRNVWYRSTDLDFKNLRDLVESTWSDMTIKKPERPPHGRSNIQMFFNENNLDR